MARLVSGILQKTAARNGFSAFHTSRAAMADSSGQFPVEASIKQKLQKQFQPKHLEVINESYMHNVPANSETHFKVVVVSDAFTEKALIARHRMVNDTLADELQSKGVHALSIVAKTEAQWQALVSQGKDKVEQSPSCRGGFGK